VREQNFCYIGREGEFYPVSNNKVLLIDRLLAIPLSIYFWWYGLKQRRKDRVKNLINTVDNDSVKSK